MCLYCSISYHVNRLVGRVRLPGAHLRFPCPMIITSDTAPWFLRNIIAIVAPPLTLDNREHLYYCKSMETLAGEALGAQPRVRVSALASGSSGNAYLVEAA